MLLFSNSFLIIAKMLRKILYKYIYFLPSLHFVLISSKHFISIQSQKLKIGTDGETPEEKS